MLKSIDILLELSIVMLVASMAVTVMTQLWTTLLNSRGRHLRDGLIGLLRHIDPAFRKGDAKAVIERLLLHPLIADNGRLGSLVHREEFTRLLLEIAGAESVHPLSLSARNTLVAVLNENGIPDAHAALAKIRDVALSLELSNPALSASARHDLAILQAASSAFVAKINGWFDQTIDRISARFAFTARRAALANALILSGIVQLDSLALINRLASDDSLRGSLIQQAYAANKLSSPVQTADFQNTVKSIESLSNRNLLKPPSSLAEWRGGWSLAKAPGIFLSTLLLSLGAPFWFEALKNLLRLRSVLAVKDDQQRERRQSVSAAAVPPPIAF